MSTTPHHTNGSIFCLMSTTLVYHSCLTQLLSRKTRIFHLGGTCSKVWVWHHYHVKYLIKCVFLYAQCHTTVQDRIYNTCTSILLPSPSFNQMFSGINIKPHCHLKCWLAMLPSWKNQNLKQLYIHVLLVLWIFSFHCFSKYTCTVSGLSREGNLYIST